jgi:predicted TIM-barrel fold metal-dependent hydrolase
MGILQVPCRRQHLVAERQHGNASLQSAGPPSRCPVIDYFVQRQPKELGEIAWILYSVDYPFEDMGLAADWFDRTAISDADRLKIGCSNAQQLFRF